MSSWTIVLLCIDCLFIGAAAGTRLTLWRLNRRRDRALGRMLEDVRRMPEGPDPLAGEADQKGICYHYCQQ